MERIPIRRKSFLEKKGSFRTSTPEISDAMPSKTTVKTRSESNYKKIDAKFSYKILINTICKRKKKN